MTVSLIVPTMNRPETIKSFLAQINSLDCADSPDEIILIDQSLVPLDLAKLDSKLPVKSVHQEVQSLTRARNLGLSHSKCEIIIFSDDDVFIPSGVISNIRKEMASGKTGLIAGIDLNTKSSSRILSYLTLSKSFHKRNIGHVTKSVLGRFPNTYNEITHTEWAMGYFFAVRKSLIIRSGILFDETLKGYGYAEDLDFSYRYCRYVNDLGYSTYFNSNVAVYHQGSLEYRQPSIKSVRMFVYYRYYLSQKLFNSFSSLLSVTMHNLFIAFERLFKLDKHFYLYVIYSIDALLIINNITIGKFKSFNDGRDI